MYVCLSVCLSVCISVANWTGLTCAHIACARSMYFPAGANWKFYPDGGPIITGGQQLTVQAPLDVIPVYSRVPPVSVSVSTSVPTSV